MGARWKSVVRSLTIAAGLLSTAASAAEFATPVLPGATSGIPVGAAAPAGIYVSLTNYYWQSRLTNNAGQDNPLRVNVFETIPTFLVVPGVKLLGADYSFLVSQGVSTSSNNIFGRKTGAVGAFNTFLSPLNLSWALTDSFFVSTGLSVYLPTGTFRLNGTSSGNGFYSWAPTIAASYLRDGWNLTARLELNLNTKNDATNYQSGDVYGVDFTATKSFGPWTVGMQGYYVNQFGPDRLNGAVVPASLYNGRGKKIEQFALGPYIAYDFGSFALSAWYDHNIRTRNGAAANIAWLRVSVPLGNPFSAAPQAPPVTLPDRKVP
ncbi:hypothetical protein MET9862_00556 [Methylobacterium symbioticum]|uniref:Phenol degradation protein meta n=1 Tax=Methylobacterium symbioticum TaxID=2584084 RepID=A0A509E8S0_9HYPH|nr:hypothetical protein MET9862_00556 [Methylobacterium symbioticum]